MKCKNVFLLFCNSVMLLFLFSYIVNAAIISGNVYDDSLDKLNDVVIKVNSNQAATQSQQYISKDGSYQFELSFGNYTIDAQYFENKLLKYDIHENISITKEGNYKLDLILFSNLEEDKTPELDADFSFIAADDNSFSVIRVLILLFVILLFSAILYIIYKYKQILKNSLKSSTAAEKSEKKQSDEKQSNKKENNKNNDNGDKEQLKLLKLLKEHKRITQKEIRQEIPLSEAKISLMIAELEHKGIVEKIKKGRGNIIILK